MTTFHTPNPIAARVDAAAGSVRLIATDRDDTVVQVRPHDESRTADVRAAEQTRVQCHNGKLTVSMAGRGFSLFPGGAIDIDIALPSRSRLQVWVATADVRAEGEFADCQISSASGNLDVDAVQGNLKAAAASGSITVQSVAGNVSVATASGSATIGQLDGDLEFKAAGGDLSVERLCGRIRARTASGSVTVRRAVRGAISAFTASGEVGVGIAEGAAARLDLITPLGTVTNRLDPADGPGEGDDTLLIHARTASGDIDIHRAVLSHRPAT
jgi:Putative adhesin